MGCINPDGTLTRSAELILLALNTPRTAEEVARETGVALFKVRSGLREFLAAGLVIKENDTYRCTQAALTRMESS